MLILSMLLKLIEFDDVIILKTKKTLNCLYLGNELKHKTEIRINCQN